MQHQVWIVDFGSQYTQLITRRSRELGFSSVIKTLDDVIQRLNSKEQLPQAIILSGGPQSVFEDQTDYSIIFNSGLPILGICYGMQIISQYFEGKVERGVKGEYGHASVHAEGNFSFPHMPKQFDVWMSHFDHVATPPNGFDIILKSGNGMIAGIENKTQKVMGLQFHPEVNHTEYGKEILNHFFC
jgi:GMP synthase (glutamine-hydrolysing)